MASYISFKIAWRWGKVREKSAGKKSII